MGLSSATTSGENILLCVFDMQRGQEEGQEIDKILFFFPPDSVYSKQLSVLGLSEGLITFTRIFSPDAGCEVIEAEKHIHIFYQAEPDIWMVMVVEKTAEAAWRRSALQGVLKEAHNLFLMFHGPVRALLDKQPNGVIARSHLYFLISDYLNDFLVGKRHQIPSFRDCLKERGTIPMLSVGRELAIEMQSLVTALESSCAGHSACKSLILFQDLLVSSSLSPDDTTTLFTYAIMRLTPHALSSATCSQSYLGKGASAANALSASMMANTGYILEASQYFSRVASPERNGHGNPVTRPLQQDIWYKGKDGFLVSNTGQEVGSLTSVTPTIWLKQSEEHMYPCIYQHKSLTVVVLVSASCLINVDHGLSMAKQRILENAYQKIVTIEEKLSRGWGGENYYHVRGYRYLMLNNDLNLCRSSPPGKVATLTKESLLALNRLRDEVDLEKSSATWDDVAREKDLEVCIRAKNNAWVIARIVGGKELYMALEKANETLLYASDAVEKFTTRYCEGAFSVD